MSSSAVDSPISWSSRLLFIPIEGSNPISSSSSSKQSSPPALSANISSPSSSPTFAKFSDKILLPQTVLQSLLDQSGPSHQLPYPLTFRITNPITRHFTHVGVREFSADEGTCLIPYAVASRIELKEGQPIVIKLVELPKATFLSLEIVESDDLGQSLGTHNQVDDWKALLEAQLRSGYTTLTKNDSLYINDPADPTVHYKGIVKDLKPSDAVLIIDTDIDLDIVGPQNSQEVNAISNKGKSLLPNTETAGNSEPITVDLSNIDQRIETVTVKKLTTTHSFQLFGLKNWSRKRPLKISIDFSKDENTTDPNLLNFFLSPSRFAISQTRFLDSTLNICDSDEKQLIVSPKNPYFQDDDTNGVSIYGIIAIPSTPSFPSTEFNDISMSFSEDVTEVDEDDTEMSNKGNDPDSKQCENCMQYVPKRSYPLHINFCARNNIRCTKGCNKIFSRQEGGIPASHWHCEICNSSENSALRAVYGNSEESHTYHDFIFHKEHSCPDCKSSEVFPNLPALAHHACTTCPSKLHICRFCHLKVPQDEATPTDILAGFTAHESFCGGKTTDCEVCHKAVRLRDLESHMKLHSFQRLSNKTPTHFCTNINCQRYIPDNEFYDNSGTSGYSPLDDQGRTEKIPYGLCKLCYGPLYNSLYDPTGAKLLTRIERRYIIQMTRGCGKSFCENREACATSMTTKLQMSEVMARVKELMVLESDVDMTEHKGKRFEKVFFCVDETTTKRKIITDVMSEDDPVYSREWIAKAMEINNGDEAKVRNWLTHNAIKLSES